MSYTYSTFVTALANTLVLPSNDPNFVTELPSIIDDAEQRCYRELDLLSTVIRDSSTTLTANSRNFTLPVPVHCHGSGYSDSDPADAPMRRCPTSERRPRPGIQPRVPRPKA